MFTGVRHLTSKPPTKLWFSRQFSGKAFKAWSARLTALHEQYPRLFDKQSFIEEQTNILSSHNNDANTTVLSDYEKKRQKVITATGEQLFPSVTIEQGLDSTPVYNEVFFDVDDQMAQNKLSTGEELVSKLLTLLQSSGLSVEDTNLRMVSAANLADQIDEWRLSIFDQRLAVKEEVSLGLPISDSELDIWVNHSYYHAPDYVREQGLLSHAEHKKVEQDWMEDMDRQLLVKLQSECANSGREFNETAWVEFCRISNDVFHPHNIDHYFFSNASKCLFRAALWHSLNTNTNNSNSDPTSVEQSVEQLQDLLTNSRDNDSEIIRCCYEHNPTLKYASLIALQLQICDPLFAAKLCVQARTRMETIAVERAISDILRDLQLPAIKADIEASELELKETMASNPASLLRNISRLQSEAATFETQVPSLDSVLDDILPLKLWTSDFSRVKSAVLAYATGDKSVTLSSITNEINTALSTFAASDNAVLTDDEVIDFGVKFHNARNMNPGWWNISDYLVNHCNERSDMVSICENQRLLKDKFAQLNIDELLTNVICVLFQEGQCDANALSRLVADYQTIMRRFRGEVDATLVSAHELDEKTFSLILDALQSANPEKKITLEASIDAGLQAGFVVRAGVQKFDFSLTTYVQQALA